MPVSFYRCVVYVSVTCVLPLSLFAASGGLNKESIDFEGNRHEYFIFVPKMNTGSAPAPMLVLLHGSGHDGRSLLYPWKKLATREGLVLVAPNAQNAAGWQSPADGPGALISIAGAVKKQYGVDANRVYLFGHSAGAVFALLMSLWEPRYFAAVAVHAGAILRALKARFGALCMQRNGKRPFRYKSERRIPFSRCRRSERHEISSAQVDFL
jgi:poly(3-hydroxybutyrate) depolymerase